MYLNMYTQLRQRMNYCPECDGQLKSVHVFKLDNIDTVIYDAQCMDCHTRVMVIDPKNVPDHIKKVYDKHDTLYVHALSADLEDEAYEEEHFFKK